jgi:hypothetical protein
MSPMPVHITRTNNIVRGTRTDELIRSSEKYMYESIYTTSKLKKKYNQFSKTATVNMDTSLKNGTKRKAELTTAKEEAAKKRRSMAADCEQRIATRYQPISTSRGEERYTAGRETTIQWREPLDWRFVTANTLHNYIPFEKSNITQGGTLKYIKGKLAKFLPPTSTYQDTEGSTPIWYMTGNQLRKAVYRAAFTRNDIVKKAECDQMIDDLSLAAPEQDHGGML